jgi:hypothetical protein
MQYLHGAISCGLIEIGHILIATGHLRAVRPRVALAICAGL